MIPILILGGFGAIVALLGTIIIGTAASTQIRRIDGYEVIQAMKADRPTAKSDLELMANALSASQAALARALEQAQFWHDRADDLTANNALRVAEIAKTMAPDRSVIALTDDDITEEDFPLEWPGADCNNDMPGVPTVCSKVR